MKNNNDVANDLADEVALQEHNNNKYYALAFTNTFSSRRASHPTCYLPCIMIILQHYESTLHFYVLALPYLLTTCDKLK